MRSCPNEELLQAYLDGELSAPTSDEVNTHLASCAPCAMLVRKIEQSFAALGSAFAVALPDAVPTARLRARIESALAEQAAPRVAWAMWFRRWRWAAALLLVAGLIGWALLGRPSIQPPQQARHETPKPAATPSLPAPAPPALEPKPERARQASRPRVRREAQAVEAVTAFYPLREGEDLTALETMQLVRVELPGSALSAIGWSDALETGPARVKADVVLGSDGLARAIRFVH